MAKKNVVQDKGKRKAYLKIIVGSMVSLTILVFAALSYGQDAFVTTAFVAIVALALGVFFTYQGVQDLKNSDAGFPIEDERSKKVMRFAAAQAYYISLYWLLAISMLGEDLGIKEPHTAISLGILGMAIAFALAWVYGNSKENLD